MLGPEGLIFNPHLSPMPSGPRWACRPNAKHEIFRAAGFQISGRKLWVSALCADSSRHGPEGENNHPDPRCYLEGRGFRIVGMFRAFPLGLRVSLVEMAWPTQQRSHTHPTRQQNRRS